MARVMGVMAAVALVSGLVGGTIWGQAARPAPGPATGPGTTSAPATGAATVRSRAARAAAANPAPVSPPRKTKLATIATFTGSNRRLLVNEPYPGDNALRYFYQVDLEGFDGPANVFYNSGDKTPGFGLNITFSGATEKGSFIRLSPTELHIRVPIAGDGMELIQQMNGRLGEADNDTGEVALNIWTGGQFTGTATTALKAPDLRQLRVDHPEVFRKYVQPLMAKLGAERAGFPEAPEAAQILAARLPADGAAETKVAAILPHLDADTREEREAASASLRELGWRGALAAQKVDLNKLAVEQRVRLRQFLAAYTHLDEKEAERCRHDVDVLVDCLALDDAVLVKAAVAQLEEVTKKKVTVDTEVPAEKRFATLEQWRAEMKGT